VSNYIEHINKVSWEGVEFPATAKSIDAFEKANPNINIIVLAWDSEFVYQWRKSDERSKTVILFLITDGDKNHYMCVKNLSKLPNTQINSDGHAKHFCLNCMNVFKNRKFFNKTSRMVFRE